jgi:DNA repair ATPase RecN
MGLFKKIKEAYHRYEFRFHKSRMKYYSGLEHLASEFIYFRNITLDHADKGNLPTEDYMPLVERYETITANKILKGAKQNARDIIVDYKNDKEERIQDILDRAQELNPRINKHNDYQETFSEKLDEIKEQIAFLRRNPKMAEADYYLDRHENEFRPKLKRYYKTKAKRIALHNGFSIDDLR